ncbi:cupin domain-containing protein [Beggiatoa leptomitoformis]|uniref:Cupin domain-containing protein n=1 Tax=Beggiatoa leptomitoformis TaxID=288004 RepID=A0A2N9YE40_9GAMM|nr:cupin domain-containing protein [Beggiatoa leptomitoformis]ALG68869.1 cupin domain-containing protein [Beggiatoa leptomitoformis]AUI68761.1 cupin domain-containing protein [Beggiatoa leptomitoformis]
MSLVKTISLGASLTPADFLKYYWQKRPLLIRQAIPNFKNPIPPKDLLDLACEEMVESRLIMEKGGKTPWEVHYSPLQKKMFKRLPKTHWTVLVQEANRYFTDAEDILDRFSFIPNWRIDDLMISYAVPEGSVGAHLDSYDVFLLQAYGKRRWQISRQQGEFIPDLELRILREFTPEEEWILEPGDMLYLPPNIAHYGVAVDECMTFSIGFLAPSHTDMLNHYVTHLVTQLDQDRRYIDPELTPQTEQGEISQAALDKIYPIINSLPTDKHSINQWFGCFITEGRNHEGAEFDCPEPPYTPEEWLAEFIQTARLRRAARMAFIREGENATLFAQGVAYPLIKKLAFIAPLLTEQREVTYIELKPYLNDAEFVQLFTDFTNLGYLYFIE